MSAAAANAAACPGCNLVVELRQRVTTAEKSVERLEREQVEQGKSLAALQARLAAWAAIGAVGGAFLANVGSKLIHG